MSETTVGAEGESSNSNSSDDYQKGIAVKEPLSRQKTIIEGMQMFAEDYSKDVKKQNSFVINQDSDKKIKWDIFVCFLLLFCVVVIPYRLAFSEDTNLWEIVYYAMDFCFLLDIFVSFFTTIQDSGEMEMITDRKRIAIEYLTGWFTLDVFSILPIDVIFGLFRSGSHRGNQLARVARVSKIYKLIRLLRLVKVFKLLKNKEKLT